MQENQGRLCAYTHSRFLQRPCSGVRALEQGKGGATEANAMERAVMRINVFFAHADIGNNNGMFLCEFSLASWLRNCICKTHERVLNKLSHGGITDQKVVLGKESG